MPFTPARSLVAVSFVWLTFACGGNPEVSTPDDSFSRGGSSAGTRNTAGRDGLDVDVGGDTGDDGSGGGSTCEADDPDCQTELPGCGDGMLEPETERCDDGNSVPGDGCSGICTIEPNFDCPATGGGKRRMCAP